MKTTSRYFKAVAAYEVISSASKSVWETVRNKVCYTVHLGKNDPIYPMVMEKLFALSESHKHKSIEMATKYNRDIGWLPGIGKVLSVSSRFTVHIGGHKVWVSMTDVANDTRYTRRSDDGPNMPNHKLEMKGYSAAAHEAMIRFLQDCSDTYETDRGKAEVFYVNSWGSWDSMKHIPTRTLSSVYGHGDQINNIVNDLSRFYGAEKQYADRSILWHRGYLFHGPPGTGKSSMAMALATHFNRNVYFLVVSDLDKDTKLMSLIAEVKNGSILVIEDIDIAKASKKRDDDDDNPKATLAGLLNSLDGFGTPHGMVVIASTNNIDALDPALIREGRIDMIEHFGYMEDEALLKMFEDWFGYVPTIPSINGLEIVPAKISELFKKNMNNSKMAEHQLIEFIINTNKAMTNTKINSTYKECV